MEHVGLFLDGRYDAQKIVNAGLLDREVKGKDDDENKGSDTAEERRKRGKDAASRAGERGGKTAQEVGRGERTADIAPRQKAMCRVGDVEVERGDGGRQAA